MKLVGKEIREEQITRGIFTYNERMSRPWCEFGAGRAIVPPYGGERVTNCKECDSGRTVNLTRQQVGKSQLIDLMAHVMSTP